MTFSKHLVTYAFITSAALIAITPSSNAATNSEVLAKIASLLPRSEYVGVDLSGHACSVQVSKAGGLQSKSPTAIYISGTSAEGVDWFTIAPTGPNNGSPSLSDPRSLRWATGFWQLTDSPFTVLKAADFDGHILTATAQLANPSSVVLLDQWQGTLTLTLNEGGNVTSIQTAEQGSNGSSGWDGTRTFYCGEN